MLCNTLYRAPRPQSVDMANKDIGIKIRENLYCVIHCTGRQAMMAVAMHCSGPAPWWAVSFELLGYANYRRGPLKRCQFSGYNFIKTRLNLYYWNSMDLVYFFLLVKISIKNISSNNLTICSGCGVLGWNPYPIFLDILTWIRCFFLSGMVVAKKFF